MPESPTPRRFEGSLVVPEGARFALVAARFNFAVVSHLLEGARDALVRHGASPGQIVEALVPGAWELPAAAGRLARAPNMSAVVALGAVIRGSTPHFDYVAGQAAAGLARVQLETGVPVVFAVLTTDSIEQAVERAGTKAGNKGFEAATAAIEMVNLFAALAAEGL
ncbi:MAG TPA: 6,7-dimethyl-8-ribityllumazine synthase [Polyangiaceae bacterium]|nr:6,7-dimethyl-8-ribityllumazine synthase [Polyangiaceae bacterium]